MQVIVIDKRKKQKKRKKRKYSKERKDAQVSGRAMTRGMERIARALADGMSDYRERSDKSARKKRDGALKDGPDNWSKAMRKAMRRSRKADKDITKAMRFRPIGG
jgi:hypothetical protein